MSKAKEFRIQAERFNKQKEALVIQQQILENTRKVEQEKQKKIENYQKITQENMQLEFLSHQRKNIEKNNSKLKDLDINSKEKEKILESLSKNQQQRRNYEKEITEDYKFSQEKQKIKKKIEEQEKEFDRIIITQAQEKLKQKDIQYKDYFEKIQAKRDEKMNNFAKTITPKVFEKDINYFAWLQHSEESKIQSENQKTLEAERKKQEEKRVMNEVLRKQTVEKQNLEMLSKEQNRAIDEDLKKRVEISLFVEEEKKYKKILEKINYREELLTQAAIDKDKRNSEYKLSEKEKILNKQILIHDKNSFQRGANQILKALEVPSRGFRSTTISPSLKNTCLQMDNFYTFENDLKVITKRNSIF